MTYQCDLHTHSTASDGRYTPTELIQMAKARSLEVLALTDHDTEDGLQEAIRVGEKLGLRIIPGVELRAKEYPTFHIFGYGFDLGASPLTELCHRMKVRRNERTEHLLEFLREKGVELTAAEVEEMAGGDIIGRPHFAQAMVRRGYVATNREADAIRCTLEKRARRWRRSERCWKTGNKHGRGTVTLHCPGSFSRCARHCLRYYIIYLAGYQGRPCGVCFFAPWPLSGRTPLSGE